MKYNILCGSYFDPLGHPIFANKIAKNTQLISKNSKVTIYGVKLLGQISINNTELIKFEGIHIPYLGKFYSIENRRHLSEKFYLIGKLISFLIRFIVITIFYIKVYRKIKKQPFIDLEYEPIQEFIGSTFFRDKSKHIMIIHNFPKQNKFNLKSIYKRISIHIYKASLNRFKDRYLGLMNEDSLNNALKMNFQKDKLVLAGWGYDQDYNNQPTKEDSENKATIKLLSFGIIRSDKRIKKLIRLFLSMDNSNIILNVVGRSLDVDIASLNEEIKYSKSKTIINIRDEYIEEREIKPLIRNNDIMVLSHSPVFESMSGPMLLAIENNKPILCFSSNTVAKLVQTTKSGMVVDMDNVNPKEFFNEIKNLSKLRYDQNALKKYQWKEITKRLINLID